MELELRPVSIAGVEPSNNLFQSPFWAAVKREQNFDIFTFDFDCPLGSSSGVAVFRPLGRGYCYAYLPWAPDIRVAEEKQGELLEALSLALKPYLPEGCLFIRFDLFWQLPYRVDEQDTLGPGATGRPPDRIREMRMNFNTEQWNLFKAPTNNQPVDTIVLNTQKDESRLLKEMKRKTRYNIRLSHRHGVYVEDASPEKLPTWYRMYAETMQRKGIKVTPYEYFEALFKTQALRSQQEERDSKDVPAIGTVLKLFMASKDSEYVAGIVLAISRDYALYLYGASLPHKRFAMPTYKLQWEAIRMAQEYGCSWYDLHGVPANKSSTNPMYGLLQFKRGFGGSVVHRRGCWDFPIKRELYNQLQLQESMSSGYYC